ncbi:hypothetical protein C5167_036723 [Papaver somniferum]|uniref:Uncharacterized protein n=1 Tax=Papaver somniferum TaxID=3469 RepID=A0A4Y7I7I3_PAPSO|nr:hypothetical protein C5167_036723 [Papaver somniferum]
MQGFIYFEITVIAWNQRKNDMLKSMVYALIRWTFIGAILDANCFIKKLKEEQRQEAQCSFPFTASIN